MQTIEELGDENTLDSLVSCLTTEGAKRGSNSRLIKQIKGFQMFFQKLMKTPAMVRMMLQGEFNFKGQVDYSRHKKLSMLPDSNYEHSGEDLLSLEWYDSTFVVPNYGDMEKWAKKCVEEYKKGKTVVALMPARVNTSWYHEQVLPVAEHRFIKGRLTFPGHKTQTHFPDFIAIFSPAKEGEPVTEETGVVDINTGSDSSRVAILSSFTGSASIDIVGDDMEEED